MAVFLRTALDLSPIFKSYRSLFIITSKGSGVISRLKKKREEFAPDDFFSFADFLASIYIDWINVVNDRTDTLGGNITALFAGKIRQAYYKIIGSRFIGSLSHSPRRNSKIVLAVYVDGLDDYSSIIIAYMLSSRCLDYNTK